MAAAIRAALPNRFSGISPQRWNNVENGKPLGNDLALLLVRKCPGLTLDWLYNGNRGGLSVSMDQRLNGLGEAGNGSTEPSATS